MHNALRHSHWTGSPWDGVHKKRRHTPRHVSGRFFYWQAKLTCTKQFWYAPISDRPSPGVGTRLYDSPVRHCLFGLDSSLAAFRAQLTGERDRPLCSNETSDLRQNWTLCDHRTSPLRITFELLSLEPRGCLYMHASRTRIVAAVSKYGEHAWDYVIISWRHNLGATFLYFIFAKCSMFHERWRLCHFQNL